MKSVVLVDVFGRFVPLDLSQPLTPAETMTTPATPAPADHPVYLAPRLMQPSRLNFNWLSASLPGGVGSFVELGAQPTASPICGWLFPNQLDGSLMLYNADGLPLGSLGSRGQALHWFPVPGERTEPGADNRAQMQAYFRDKNANAVLGQFLSEFLYAGDALAARPRLLKFMQVISLAQQFIITPAMQQSADLALLIGQPLVLTQATLALEQKGQPAVSLDLTSYPEWNKAGWQFELSSKAFIPYNPANLNQGNLGQLRVPVKVGTTEVRAGDNPVPYFDDGLAAYFVAGDYSTMYTPVRTATANGIVSAAYPAPSPVELRPNAEPVLLTMLLDPRAAVHATTGLLPVSQVAIPGSGFAHVAEQLQVSFPHRAGAGFGHAAAAARAGRKRLPVVLAAGGPARPGAAENRPAEHQRRVPQFAPAAHRWLAEAQKESFLKLLPMPQSFSLSLHNPALTARPDDIIYTGLAAGNVANLVLANNSGFDLAFAAGPGAPLLLNISSAILDKAGADAITVDAPWRIAGINYPADPAPVGVPTYFGLQLLPATTQPIGFPDGGSLTITLRAVKPSTTGTGAFVASYPFDGLPMSAAAPGNGAGLGHDGQNSHRRVPRLFAPREQRRRAQPHRGHRPRAGSDGRQCRRKPDSHQLFPAEPGEAGRRHHHGPAGAGLEPRSPAHLQAALSLF